MGQVAGQNCLPSGLQVPAGGVGERRLGWEDLHLALLGVSGAERHGAVAVLGEGLAGDDIPEIESEHVGRLALCLWGPVAGVLRPAVRPDCGGEEEVGTVEGPVVLQGEFVGKEDCF